MLSKSTLHQRLDGLSVKWAIGCFGASLICGMATETAGAQTSLIGQIIPIAGTYCPQGTIAADGELQTISSNNALFSVLGTLYGGDGMTTFGLPDLRGAEAINLGQGPGLPPYQQGQRGGTTSATLTQQTMPAHTHTGTGMLQGIPSTATVSSPTGASLAGATNGTFIYNGNAPDQAMSAGSIGVTVETSGSGQPFQHQSPVLAIRWCVVAFGVYPSRS